ncbi:MAG: Cof-type HAD-IIB family hydrolase [Dehalococcoidales bacterium]|nr:Cof-type HAD-IIB family hydrolase [Dehalococcoidales bacterium]
MKYKLLVVDIDGTLVNKHGVISSVDAAALAKAKVGGVIVALSTGRVIKGSENIINELSLDGYHIFFDGAVVSDPAKNDVIYSKPIKPEIVKRAINFALANDIYLELYTTEKFYAGKKNWSDLVHHYYFGIDPVIVDLNEICMCERIVKAELISRSQKEDDEIMMFKKEFDGSLRFSLAHSPAYPNIEFMNIVDPEVSKGEALKFMMAYYGVEKDEVIAIGDGHNDIPLLEVAGTKVAMGNAFDELKKVADYITIDVDNSGVAAAIDRFLFS